MKFKFNVPNNITIIRVGLIPLFAIVLLADIPYRNILSAFIFGMLSVSDFLDGYFARKKKQVTDIGKLIDPIADKLLISTALILLVGKGIDLWMAVAIIAREFIVTAIRIYLLPSKIVVPASNFGKAKTVVQSIAIVFALLNLPLSWHVMLAAVLLTLVSGIEYLFRIRRMTGNKVVNLPNIITLSRFLLIFPLISLFLNGNTTAALLVFAIIALSDKLDGISARLMNQKTELGSGFDSFTDWTSIITMLVLMVINGYMGTVWAVLLVAPSIVSGIMKILYAKKQKIVPVTFIARLSVGFTYLAIALILLNFIYASYLLAATVALVFISMAIYIFKTISLPRS